MTHIARLIENHLKFYRPVLLAGGTIRYFEGYARALYGKKGKLVRLEPKTVQNGNVLVSYILDPFLRKPGESISDSHTNHWESWQIAQTFLDLGYAVDVINFENSGHFLPRRDYSIFVDTRWNLQRLAHLLPDDCIKIMHIDLCHMLFNNSAEARRLLELQDRRGITLTPRRYETPNLAIEHADCATILGNEFTMRTFQYAKKPLFPIPISTPCMYPWSESKDFDACRRNFLWFGSGGFIRKGLDLVLEAFAGMPEYHLTVCGPIEEERDFRQAFTKELYDTPNIHTLGWVDVCSAKFQEIINNCLGLVFPSAAEGQCGGVVTCLHAGLVPIVSYESGVDIHDFGIILKECSISEIQGSVQTISSLPVQDLRRMARGAWEYARGKHTRQRFAEEYQNAIHKILAMQSNTKPLNGSLP
jgi:glycosyltransferase involved in cell wall biosynthesis